MKHASAQQGVPNKDTPLIKENSSILLLPIIGLLIDYCKPKLSPILPNLFSPPDQRLHAHYTRLCYDRKHLPARFLPLQA